MRRFRIMIAMLAASAVALAIPASPAQARPIVVVDIDYSTSCGRVSAISSTPELVAVYYGPATIASNLQNADGMILLDQYEFQTISTLRPKLYVIEMAWDSETTGAVKTLTVAQNCTGVTAKVSITGKKRVGATLTAKVGKWVPKPLFRTYTWYRSGKAITGANDKTYTLTSADKGKRIKVKSTATFVGYTSVTRTSKATAKIKAGVLTTKLPKVTIHERMATATAGTWGPAPVSLKYQWYVGSKKIKGATTSIFAVPTSYIGKKMRVRVTGKKAGYTAVVRYSKRVLVTASS